MSRSVAASTLLASFLLLSACESGAALGTTCETTSACRSPLACRLGRCRNECAENRDCPAGAQCYLDPDGLGACEVEVDHSCGAESCGVGLMCLASECVRACSNATGCPVDGLCTIASGASIGVCSDARGGIDAGVGDAAAPIDASTPIDSALDGGPSCIPLDAVHVCTSVGFSCAIRADSSVVCWGEADTHRLGVPDPATLCDTAGGPNPCQLLPVQVPLELGGNLTTAQELGCGDDFACARLASGRVRCWGRNYTGMLGVDGDGITGAREVVDVHGVPITGATQIVVGDGHVCARLASSVVCWGDDARAQLGRNTMGPGLAPGDAPELIAAGAFTSLVAMSEGTCVVLASSHLLSCLGDNGSGQLEVDAATLPLALTLQTLSAPTLDATSPVVSGGLQHACAIDASGHVQCWGWNDANSLGRHDTVSSDQPMPQPLYGPAGARTFTALFSGTSRVTNCGVSGNDLFCWGSNANGEAGQDPNLFDSIDATIIDGLPQMAEGACGQEHCCGIDVTGHAWCWGANEQGELGRGTASAYEWVPAHVCAPAL